MADSFDPYYTWLGIPPAEQPPDYYRLLGVQRFESDPEVIQNGCDQRMAFLRNMQSGPRMRWSQHLLNEVAAAAGCLLDPERKWEYDSSLRHIHAPPPLAPARSVASGGAALPQIPIPAAPYGIDAPNSSPPVSNARRGAGYRLPIQLISIVLGGIAGIGIAIVILHNAFHIDITGLWPVPTAPGSQRQATRNESVARAPAANPSTTRISPPVATASKANTLPNNSSPPEAEPAITYVPKPPGTSPAAQTPATTSSPASSPTNPFPIDTSVTAAPSSTPSPQPSPASQPVAATSIPALPRQAVVAEIPQPGALQRQHVVFRPDGKVVAFWNDLGKEVTLCPLANVQAKAVLPGSQVVFSSDSKQFVITQPGRGLAFYRFSASGKFAESAALPLSQIVRSMAVSGDGKLLLAGVSGPQPLGALVITTQKVNDRIKTTLPEVAWIGVQGDLVVCSTSSGNVETISLSSTRQHDSLPLELGSPPIMLFEQAGSPSLLAHSTEASSGLQLDIWNLKSKTRVTTPVLSQFGARNDLLAVSSDGQLAAIRRPRAVSLVQIASGQEVTRLEWSEGGFRAAALTTADGLLAVNGPENRLWVIDLARLSAQPAWRIPPRDERLTQDVAAADSGNSVAASASKNTAVAGTSSKLVTANEARSRPLLPKGTFDAVFVKPGSASSGNSDFIFAWEFVPKSDITVTHLGVYDHQLDGLKWPHEVAIWDISEPATPLVAGIVPAGGQAPLAGAFLLVPVNRAKLEAGKSYTVGAHYTDSGDMCVGLTNPQGLIIEYSPQLSITAYRYAFPYKQIAFPTVAVKDLTFNNIGPTFRFEAR